ncbi:MAG TPA: carboxypeptidase-like regulatory domain-containing protein [Pedobacter sp.]|jgi:hypothetical protein
MKLISLCLLIALSWNIYAQQAYKAGFKTFVFTDSSRVYKPNTSIPEKLHFRSVELDIWYPSQNNSTTQMLFRDFLKLFEQRATLYEDKKDYSGLTEELAELFTTELGFVKGSGKKLLNIQTNSYKNLKSLKEKKPLILYMAGSNGMGFENYKLLETLAQNGYVVVSIWSVGRYPGNMTNNKLDMMEQVYDAEAAIKVLEKQNELAINFDRVGIIGCSWGGMSASVFNTRNPRVKAMVSLDGTETHYFGEDEKSDDSITEIHNSNILKPESQPISYFYLESNDKFNDFIPSGEYNYYKKMRSSKYYLRVLNSKHGDFLCIPSIINASQNSVETYNTITKSSLTFFNSNLKNEGRFDSYYTQLLNSKSLFFKPFELRAIENKVTLKGNVTDKSTELPLPYVNVGTKKSEIGTVTNEGGEFELKLPHNLNDTVRISMIGYKAQAFPTVELLGEGKLLIKLEKDSKQLKEVVITAKKTRLKTIGNKTTSKFLSTGFGYNQLGAEMCIRINIRKKPTFVNAFNFNISYNRLSSDALFRLNIYNINNGKPKDNILNENITIPISARQTGLISVDLKPYNIVLDEDVMVSIEWLKNEKETKKGEAIFFSLGLFSGGTFVKPSSQGKMKKHSSMGVGFNLDVRY